MLLGKGKRNTQIYPAGDLQREEQPNFPLTDQLAEPKGRVDFTFFFFFYYFLGIDYPSKLQPCV